MTESVKPRRRYQSRRRAEQAAQTRHDIVAAAGVLFRDEGYAVPMTKIARKAGVAVETVYRIFGTKAGLFTAAVEALLAGGSSRAEIPVPERAAIRAIREEPDPRKQIAGYASIQPGIHRRAGPLLRALRDAGSSDPELQQLWEQLETSRLQGQGRFVQELADRDLLRPELTREVGADVLWVLSSLAVHDLLVVDRGWTSERYVAWLAEALSRELLAP